MNEISAYPGLELPPSTVVPEKPGFQIHAGVPREMAAQVLN